MKVQRPADMSDAAWGEFIAASTGPVFEADSGKPGESTWDKLLTLWILKLGEILLDGHHRDAKIDALLTSASSGPMNAMGIIHTNAHAAAWDMGLMIWRYIRNAVDSQRILAGLPKSPKVEYFLLTYQEIADATKEIRGDIRTLLPCNALSIGAAIKIENARLSKTACPPDPSGSPTQDFVPDKHDMLILRGMRDLGCASTIEEIADKSGVGKRTVDRRIQPLIKAGLAIRQKGSHGGTAITDLGLALISRIDGD